MEEVTDVEFIEHMCGMVVVIYVKEDDVKLFTKRVYEEFDVEIIESLNFKTLEDELSVEANVVKSYEKEFKKSIEKFGSPKKSYKFLVDYREERNIPIILQQISTDNDITITINLVMGSRYLGGKEYETVAYIIDSNRISHGRHNRFDSRIPQSTFLFSAKALNLSK